MQPWVSVGVALSFVMPPMAKAWVLKTGIIEDTHMFDIMSSMYSDLKTWFHQWKNISLEFIDIKKENLRRALDQGSPEGAEWLFFPCEMSLFSAERSPDSPRISLAILETSTYMLSMTPTKKIVPSLHILKMQSVFIFCLLASLMFISALMCVGSSLTLKNLGYQFLDNLWRNSLLFFYEPFNCPPRTLSWRILLAVWLIAISFIYIDLCSNLKSKFTETEYFYVDSMANLPRNRYRDVFVVKDYVEEGFINKMAEIDDKYRELKKQMRLVDESYFFMNNLPYNFVLILAELLGKIAAKDFLTVIFGERSRGQIAFSKPLYSTFIVFPIARNSSSRTVEVINDMASLEMESKILAKYFNEMDFLFFGVKWTKPVETFDDVSFSDIKSVVDHFVIGLILAVLLLMVEYSTAVLREMLNFSSRLAQQ